jgi:hypothetical protein
MGLRAAFTLAVCLAVTDFAFAQDTRGKAISGIGYPSVASALDGLRAKNGVNISVQSGWTVIEDRSTLSLWSFTPPGHPAHPAAIHRKVIQEGDNFFMQMNVLCEAAKPACDALVSEFEKLNQRMTEDMKRRKTVR